MKNWVVARIEKLFSTLIFIKYFEKNHISDWGFFSLRGIQHASSNSPIWNKHMKMSIEIMNVFPALFQCAKSNLYFECMKILFIYYLIWWMKICIKEYKILFPHIWKGPKIKEGPIELEKHSLLFEMGEK